MNKRFLFSTLTVLSLACLAGCNPPNANGAKDDTRSEADAQIAEGDTALGKIKHSIETASGGSFTATKTFDGPDGLVGVVLKPKNGVGATQIGWASKNGDVVTPGPLYDKDGKNLSEQALNEHGDQLSAEKAADKLLSDRIGFTVDNSKGKAGVPNISIFFEPYCGYCSKMFAELKPEIDSGRLKARFVMVSFLHDDSAARAADILKAKDPYKALSDWETRDKNTAGAAKGDSALEATVHAASKLMNDAGQSGTPATLFCNKNGNHLEWSRGAPGDMKSFLASLSNQGHALCN